MGQFPPAGPAQPSSPLPLSDEADGTGGSLQIRDDLPPEVMTEQFTQRVHGRLTEGGAYFVNVLSHYNGSGAEPHAAVAATVRRVFGNVQVFVSDSQALPVVPYYWKYQVQNMLSDNENHQVGLE